MNNLIGLDHSVFSGHSFFSLQLICAGFRLFDDRPLSRLLPPDRAFDPASTRIAGRPHHHVSDRVRFCSFRSLDQVRREDLLREPISLENCSCSPRFRLKAFPLGEGGRRQPDG